MAFGQDPFHPGQRVARGVIAVGPVAVGVVAIGPVALGVVTMGQVAVGLAFGLGQLACGVVAVGHMAAGWLLAAGQAAFGHIAAGELTGRLLLPLALAWIAAGGAGAVFAWRKRRRLARLAGHAAAIRVARPGLVCVRGRVVPLRTVVAPVSKRQCVAYDVRRVRHGRPPKAEQACEDFVVEDASGRARVIASDAVLVLEPIKRAAQAVETRLVVHEAAGGRFGPRPGGVVRPVGTAHERVLLAGDEVQVSGIAVRQVGGDAPMPLVVHAGAPGPVLVTNRDVTELRAESLCGALLAAVLLSGGLVLAVVSLLAAL